jgi:endonuclease/exonuclease/phosphatase family metal-dependent hydrolase
VEGRHYQVASTHLESDLAGNPLSPLRAIQMQELLEILGPESRTVLLGDLNDFQGSPMYQLARAAGFQDAWVTLSHGENDGFTCCHDADLSNEAPGLNQRIDFVLARGFGREEGMMGAIRRILVRVPGPVYPIWQSDHAGVIARLERPQREGQE